jgi:hypothetical protein
MPHQLASKERDVEVLRSSRWVPICCTARYSRRATKDQAGAVMHCQCRCLGSAQVLKRKPLQYDCLCLRKQRALQKAQGKESRADIAWRVATGLRSLQWSPGRPKVGGDVQITPTRNLRPSVVCKDHTTLPELLWAKRTKFRRRFATKRFVPHRSLS